MAKERRSSNSKKPDTTGLLKISELAKQSGVSNSTIKHYINEGLISFAVKTSRNMAYYDPSTVDKVKQIKQLQKERFLPLPVIKRLLSSKTLDDGQIKLGDAIHRTRKIGLPHRQISEQKISGTAEYPKEKIDRLTREGILKPEKTQNGLIYDEVDIKIIDLIKQRDASGLDPEYTYSIFKTYSSHLEKAIEDDVKLFATKILGKTDTDTAVDFIEKVDEYLDQFIMLYRHKTSRLKSEEAIEELNRMLEELPEVLLSLPEGTRLPLEPPEKASRSEEKRFPLERSLYFLLRGDFPAARTELAETSGINAGDYWCMETVLQIYHEGIDSAAEEAVTPPPKGHEKDPMVLMVQILVTVLQLRKASGFIRPIVLCNHLLQLVKVQEKKSKIVPQRAMGFLLSTAKGLTGIMMPRIFGVFNDGASLLLDMISLKGEIPLGDIELSYDTPKWLIAVLKEEFFPRIQQKTDEIVIRRCLDCNEMEYTLHYVNTLADSFGKKSKRYKNALSLLNRLK